MEPTTVTVTALGSPISASLASVIVTVAVFSSPSSSDGSETALIVSSALASPPKDTVPPEIALPFCSQRNEGLATHRNGHRTNFVPLHGARKEVNRFAFSLVDADAVVRELNGRRLLAAQDSDRGRIRIVNAAPFSLHRFRSSSVHEHERNLFIPEPGHCFRLDLKHDAVRRPWRAQPRDLADYIPAHGVGMEDIDCPIPDINEPSNGIRGSDGKQDVVTTLHLGAF